MKAEFTLTVDSEGNPMIEFKHHDKSNELEQKLLGIFVESAQTTGIELKHTRGHIEMGTDNSWEGYVIKAKRI